MLGKFSSGLPAAGRAASWVFAFAVVYGGNEYYKDVSKKSAGITFTDEEREQWNTEKKKRMVGGGTK
jgi:hypothetical protein